MTLQQKVKMESSHESAVISKKLMDAILPLIKDEEIIIIHSALSKLGFEKSSNYLKGLMDFLEQLIEMNKTVLLPSFTFSFPKRKKYHYLDPSETGKLADFAQEYLNFERTKNPMFSFVLEGPRKKRFLATRTNSGYGDKTAVSELASKDVAVVMLGAGWDSCTVIHSVEERQNVPYRIYTNWNYPVDFGNGLENHNFQAFVRDRNYNTELNFKRIREVLIKEKKLRQSRLNHITLEAANGQVISELASQMIKEDPYYFVSFN
ncbi:MULTISPECIES: AAC(3) family N-acetyltransferase [Bacillus cereus group]|nr:MULTISPECIES: AAC(3) family N-acetyltransferase [Bacillus cereus group]